jgi:hypothetical protein
LHVYAWILIHSDIRNNHKNQRNNKNKQSPHKHSDSIVAKVQLRFVGMQIIPN